jgi:hypothetical protein
MRRSLLFAVLPALLTVSACDSPERSPDASQVPNDVEVTIINENVVPGARRSLDVRLSRRLTEEELEAVALDLRDRADSDFPRTFIVYYLPGMRVDAGGWATTHFDPTLEVRILGTTTEQDAALQAPEEETPERDVIGTWLDDRPFVTHRVTIYREDGRTYLERRFPDGSSGREVVVETTVPRGQKFQTPDPGVSGDYYLLVSGGALEVRDDEGLITVARPVR